MGWFNISKKNKIAAHYSLDFIGVDIHSHLLPGIDDGAKTIEDSLRYIKALQQLGFFKFYTTPHIFMELYPNHPERIEEALNKVKNQAHIESLSVDIYAAAEYMMDEQFKKVFEEQKTLVVGKSYVLIEMSYAYESPLIEEYIFDLKIKGYTPILAHPERYNYYHHTLDKYYRFKDLGCLLQLNLLSLTGYYGKEIRKTALQLLSKGWIDVVGTDVHHDRHIVALQQFTASGELHTILGQYPIKNKELFS